MFVFGISALAPCSQKSEVIVPVLLPPSPVKVAPGYSGESIDCLAGLAVPAYEGPVSASKVNAFVPSVNVIAEPLVLTENESVPLVTVNVSVPLTVIVGVVADHAQSPELASVVTPLIAPLATMLLGQTHALRNNLMLPPLILISAFAISNLSKISSLIFTLAMGIQFIFILLTVYFFAPNKFGSFWSLDAKNASLAAIGQDKSKNVVLSTKIDNIEYAYPVYAKVDPHLVISQYGKFPKVYGNVIINND